MDLPFNGGRPSFACPLCLRKCTTSGGLARHYNMQHREFTPASEDDEEHRHSTDLHDEINARPCDINGNYLPSHSPPPPLASLNGQALLSWQPFASRTEFDFAHFHFVEAQSSAGAINTALDLWAAQILKYGEDIPWKNAAELYSTIDSIQHGDAPWKWMMQTYELCTRDVRAVLHTQLTTTDFKGQFNYTPYRQFNGKGRRVWSNLMSGDWAWKQADDIVQDPSMHGCMLVPLGAGSDKTTVSVATGHQEYHPVYVTPGNITNIVRRAHGNGVLPASFLPIPKALKRQRKTVAYQRFVRQMYHACLALIFEPLKAGMTTPEVVRCPDGHFRRAVYTLGPYIADYPEQVWLACIVQNWCPKCDAPAKDLDSPGARIRTQAKTDLLITTFDPGILWDDFGIRHDVVGTFKDHLVEWVMEYLHDKHGQTRALEIIADIDHRISAVSSFPGLRHFPDGRDFQQWTGDDLKALMKVYLAAIAGHVPPAMLRCMSAFLNFCYLVRRNAISADTLDEIQDALNLKEPWRRSNRHNALIQMLRTLMRLDRLAAIRSIFASQGMMQGSTSSYAAQTLQGEAPEAPEPAKDDDDDDDGGGFARTQVFIRAFPKNITDLAAHIQQPLLPELVRRFLYEQLNPDSNISLSAVPLDSCPRFDGRVRVFLSAVARFLCSERPLRGPVGFFVVTDPDLPGMHGMEIGRVFLFFSSPIPTHTTHAPLSNGTRHSRQDDDTSMWVVTYSRGREKPPPDTCSTAPGLHCARGPSSSVYGSELLPDDFHFSYSLDSFRAFFVNRYTDHHTHEFLSE
ncbi:hypothetical protein B0H14DRAFT_3092576 [Mycena olivaceomarginata]|nr:hypothetical protein B0H14DRAFT_3092576 [Mycena olivaceomarginata]